MALTRKGAARRRERIEALERPDYGWIWKPFLTLLVIALLIAVALGIWWSRTPATFDVEQATAVQRTDTSPAARGTVTTAALMTTLDTLLDKPGGYLRNDIAPPGVWLDNMPSWELGVLNQARDLTRALPAMEEGHFALLDEVAERLTHDSSAWFNPSFEDQLEESLVSLEGYLQALGSQNAGFAAGAGLAGWLDQVGQRLDGLGMRLSASVGSRDRLRELGLDDAELPSRTPWYRVDNIFFEARGSGWALIHFLEAIRRDQADVLEASGALDDLALLVAELERTQRRLWSPMILNGSGFGIFANHSLVMANHIVRARDLTRQIAERVAEAEKTGAIGKAAGSEEASAPVEAGESAEAPSSEEAPSPPADDDAPNEPTDDPAADNDNEAESVEEDSAAQQP
ncbi:DUF2333 family protein [Halomonas korlensis]|uniref:DUF2333 domain-containing protein n=1 Tax=Halomonas korlensis TaxID=463301 RepID=A0A1I7FEZ4_9GAMM|nr:DUF2333 family protein [Halomonas korlensis]SFU34665.1 hypothetical protein SAMN04487955_101433 [Halomonas korlensis]